MGELAMALGEHAYFDRPVLDRTGLTGNYDTVRKRPAGNQPWLRISPDQPWLIRASSMSKFE